MFGMHKAIMGPTIEGKWQINTSSLQQSLRHQHPSATSLHRSRISSERERFDSVKIMAALQARSTQKVQQDWHVLPDGTKLEVLMQTYDTVRRLSIDKQDMQTLNCAVSCMCSTKHVLNPECPTGCKLC